MKDRELTPASRKREAARRQENSGGQLQSWKLVLMLSLIAFVGYGVWTYLQLPDQASAALSYGLPLEGTQLLSIQEAALEAQATSGG